MKRGAMVDRRNGVRDQLVYELRVFFPGDLHPRHTERIRSAPDTLSRIHMLLAEHSGCEKIAVFVGETRLFSVDCKGNSSPG